MLRERACVAALAALALSLPSMAGAQAPAPVEVQVDGVFGDELLIGDGYATVVVTVRNLTRTTFSGEVSVDVHGWEQPSERHVVPLDVPGGQTRRVLLTLFVADSVSIDARFRVGGATLGTGSQGTAYAPGGGGVVVLADPPRLRAALLDLQATVRETATDYYGSAVGEREVELPVGIVGLDAATADPILPDDALGWSRIRTLVVSAPMLARIQAAEMQAIEDWIRLGGSVLVFPRTDADLRLPFVREHFGEVTRSDAPVPITALTPVGARAIHCSEGQPDTFGCARRIGFGAVYLASWDGAAPPGVDEPATRELVRAVAQRAGEVGPMEPILRYGQTRDTFQSEAWRSDRTFARLRAALDPNEGYRPALGLVAIVLLLYVFAVGPVNFTLVQRRNQPTLALLTTPALAFGCVLVMLGVGYLGKGVLMRYRRLELVEVVQGERTAGARRYTGYFLTRPTVTDITSPERGRAMRLSSGGGDDGLVYRDGAVPPVLAGIRGGLWETIFTREDRVIDLGGELDFVVDGRRLAAVANRSSMTLRGAFVVDAGGGVYTVGDLAPGATSPIPRETTTSIAGGSIIDGVDDPGLVQVARLLGLPEDDLGYLLGFLRLTGGLTREAPVLYAIAEPDAAPTTSPGFSLDADYRIVALRPRLDLAPLAGGLALTAPTTPLLDSFPAGAIPDSLQDSAGSFTTPGWGEPAQVGTPEGEP